MSAVGGSLPPQLNGMANDSDLPPPNGTMLEAAVSAFYIYYTPLLVLLGTIGNLVSIAVFYASKLRLQSTSNYLSALAISDTIFLLQMMAPWLNAVQLNDVFLQYGFCQFFMYVSYVTSCLSAWLVVAFTVERFVAVLYPLKRNSLCTVRRARVIIGSVALAALLLNVPVLRFTLPADEVCSIDYEYIKHAERFNLVDTVVSFTVPLAIIIFLNAWITVGVCRLERARQQLMQEARRESAAAARAGARRPRPTRLLGAPRSQQRVTRMLLIVSTAFVVFNLPAYTMRVVVYASPQTASEYDPRGAVQQVTMMFFHTNFGINFILYCLSGQNFRRALLQIMCCRRRERAGAGARNITFRANRASSASTSFISTCTEVTNYGVSSVTTNPQQRRRGGTFITRWTFDNSAQRRRSQATVPAGEIEMSTIVAPMPEGAL